jgi:hypothetical protein
MNALVLGDTPSLAAPATRRPGEVFFAAATLPEQCPCPDARKAFIEFVLV